MLYKVVGRCQLRKNDLCLFISSIETLSANREKICNGNVGFDIASKSDGL